MVFIRCYYLDPVNFRCFSLDEICYLTACFARRGIPKMSTFIFKADLIENILILFIIGYEFVLKDFSLQ